MEPPTGERFFREWPYLNTVMVQLCVDAFAQAFPESLNSLLLDNRGAPMSQPASPYQRTYRWFSDRLTAQS